MLRTQNHIYFIGLLCLMLVVARVAFDVYLPALPVIQHDFLTTEHKLQLSISLFSLGFGVSQLFYGPLSDRFGRRSLLFIGMALFIFSSIYAYYSTSINALIVSRFITGLGVGAGVVISRAICRDRFEGKALARISSIQTLVLAVGLFAAPLLGSYLLNWFSWRADFLFLILLGVVSSVLFYVSLPETNRVHQRQRLSAAFKSYFAIIRHNVFVRNVLMMSFSFSGLIVYLQLSPFILEKQYGLSPVVYSWLSLAVALAYCLGTIHMTRLLKTRTTDQIIVQGTMIMIASGVLLVAMQILHVVTVPGILISSMIYIYGLRFVYPTGTANSLSPFKNNAGASAALLGAITMGITALVSFICSLIHFDQTLLLGLFYAALGVISLLVFLPLKHVI